jgi:hypothetical protein
MGLFYHLELDIHLNKKYKKKKKKKENYWRKFLMELNLTNGEKKRKWRDNSCKKGKLGKK